MLKYVEVRYLFAYWAAMFFGGMIFLFIFVGGIGFGFDVKTTVAFFESRFAISIFILLFIYTGAIAIFSTILFSPKPNQNPPSSS